MNEFLQQFLVESRELVEQASEDLLAFETEPAARERLDGVFRAFHTLKGAAAIVDFTAMERTLHAAEDVLGGLRAGRAPEATAQIVSDCLACLDQVTGWLNAMEAQGAPPVEAAVQADVLIRRFGSGARRREASASPEPESDAWIDQVLARCSGPPPGAATAIRFQPDRDCFYRGEDPLEVVAELPGLLGLDLKPASPWPALEALDPFACNLEIRALTTVPEEVARDLFAGTAGRIEIRSIAGAGRRPALAGAARALLEAQVLMLDQGEANAGCAGSAARVTANILTSLGLRAEAKPFARLLEGEGAPADPRLLRDALRRLLAGEPPEEPQAPAPDQPQLSMRGGPETTRTLRVDVERVDALVSLTSELTVAKNALGHAAALARDTRDPAALADLLRRQHAVLERLTADLQRSVLDLRVLPLRVVFQRFSRLVRELAVDLGKSARLNVEGEATEADKAVVETLFEPLLHVVRNALDHGVEPVEARLAAGKPRVATITLSARREGDQVVVEVSDDGRGVDVDRVRTLAAERGLVAPEALAALDDASAANLVFMPGFSTAEVLTDTSGRGVGMDAVRSAVERLGGRVLLESRRGQGTAVRFILPFTVMMTSVMTVEVSGQMFGIPLEAVVETLRTPRSAISPVGAAQAVAHRDRTLPLIDLARTLGDPGAPRTSETTNLVVISADGHVGAVEVDRLGERMELMLKPLDGLLAAATGVAGTTLLGDGRVLVVLDVAELLQ